MRYFTRVSARDIVYVPLSQSFYSGCVCVVFTLNSKQFQEIHNFDLRAPHSPCCIDRDILNYTRHVTCKDENIYGKAQHGECGGTQIRVLSQCEN